MAAASGTALALAARLRALDDAGLERLIRERGVRQQGVRDYFDLADALLDRGSIQSALERLDRPTLALIALAGELAADGRAPTIDELAEKLEEPLDDVADRVEVAVETGLVGTESGGVVPWDAVVGQLRSWPSLGLPSAEELRSVPPPAALEPVSEVDARFADRGAGERAFAAVTAIAELLLELRTAPARRLSRGGLALPDARRLAAATATEADDIGTLLDTAVRAGLVTVDPRAWAAAPRVDDWLILPRRERWLALAGGWLARLPAELRTLLRRRAHAVWGEGLLDYLDWRYPAGRDWVRTRVGLVVREAEQLGLLSGTTPSTFGAALLAEGEEAAREAVAPHFPAEVDRVYLQHDLSVVAPGPLSPEVDLGLRRLADPDAKGLASSYRLSPASVTRALVEGATADELLRFLASLSLTGIPQPIDYLIRDTAERFGALRVGPLTDSVPTAPTARSYLRSGDPALLGQLLVDPNLAALGLTDAGNGLLVTRFDVSVAYWTLHDARYPVLAEDASGAAVPLERPQPPGAEEAVSDDTASILVARVRGSDEGGETDEAGWIARQLELAAKNKVAVVVSVRLPDGRDVDYLLEPASVARGRLRARDRAADIERTLPMSSIIAVAPAD